MNTPLSLNTSHKLIMFDNDGTLNTQFSCWRYIQNPLGIFEPDGRRILEDHLAGNMDYEEFSIKAVSQWKGLKIDDLNRVIAEIDLREGTLEVLNYFKDHNYKVVVASSGFDLWKSVFESEHGFVFDDYLANHIEVDSSGLLTGGVQVNVTDDTPLKNKGEHLKKLCKKYSINPDQTIMVGDGLGDIKAFNVSGLSFAVEPTHDAVSEASDHVISDGSLLKILDYFKDGMYTGIQD